MDKRAEFTPQASKAALILQGVLQAIDSADSALPDVQECSNWLMLIEAATENAYFLLTGESAEHGSKSDT